jgi:hypothetical protein
MDCCKNHTVYAKFIDMKAPAWLTVTLAVAWADRTFLLTVTVAGIHKQYGRGGVRLYILNLRPQRARICVRSRQVNNCEFTESDFSVFSTVAAEKKCSLLNRYSDYSHP